jgi:hypothetical protein
MSTTQLVLLLLRVMAVMILIQRVPRRVKRRLSVSSGRHGEQFLPGAARRRRDGCDPRRPRACPSRCQSGLSFRQLVLLLLRVMAVMILIQRVPRRVKRRLSVSSGLPVYVPTGRMASNSYQAQLGGGGMDAILGGRELAPRAVRVRLVGGPSGGW